MVSEELIKRYFSPHCTEEEKRKIFQYFEEHPGDFLEQFSDAEFEAFISEGNYSKKILSGLRSLNVERGYTARRKWRYAAAAAIILLLIGGALYNKTNPLLPGNAINGRRVTAVLAPNPNFLAINTSNKPIELNLPDHSKVTLYPESKISYMELVNPTKRAVVLEGTAIFNVTHDASNPFTVFCKEVATTDIGTVFQVSTEKRGRINVKLLEGKIRVCSIVNKKVKSKIYYLLAGNSISFNRNSNRFTLHSEMAINEKKIPLEKPEILKSAVVNKAVATEFVTSTGKRFEGTALSSVLDYIADEYHVKISYPTKVIKHIRFVGTLQNREPVGSLLKNLALMNNLSLFNDTANHTYILKELPEETQ